MLADVSTVIEGLCRCEMIEPAAHITAAPRRINTIGAASGAALCGPLGSMNSATPARPATKAAKASSSGDLSRDQELDEHHPKRDRRQHDGRQTRWHGFLRVSQGALAAAKQQDPAYRGQRPSTHRRQPGTSELRKSQQDCSRGNGANANHQEWRDRLRRDRDREIRRSPQEIDCSESRKQKAVQTNELNNRNHDRRDLNDGGERPRRSSHPRLARS